MAKISKLLVACRWASKPTDKIQLMELKTSRRSMQDWSNPGQLNDLPYEILLEILQYIVPTKIPIRCKLFHSPMLGIPSGGLDIAYACKRLAAVVGELLYSRNWFEISGGAPDGSQCYQADGRDPKEALDKSNRASGFPSMRSVYYGMELKGLGPLSSMSQAQIYLTNLRIHVIGKEIDEFRLSDFTLPLKKLRSLKIIELKSISYEADAFLCRELVPYLLAREELNHVPVITLARRERRLQDDLRAEHYQAEALLEQRNKTFLLADPLSITNPLLQMERVG